jgi:leucyl-tRNA synthetase
MEFTLNATPGELLEKGDALVRVIARTMQPVHPDLAEALLKALPEHEHAATDYFPVMKELAKQAEALYADTLKAMLAEIDTVLDESVSEKEVEGSTLQKAAKIETDYIDPLVGLLAHEKKVYHTVQELAATKGYGPREFEAGGQFYGMSVEEIRAWLKRAS